MATVLSAAKKKAATDFYNAVKQICPGYNLAALKAITAQAMNESAWGQSSLSKKYFNYFGMKCGSSWRGASVNLATKEEYKVGTITNIKANFRAYSNLTDGVKGYCEFITGMSRYKNLLGVTNNDTFIERIKADGWATDSKYISTLKSVMQICEDNGVFDEPKTVTPVATKPNSVSATQSNGWKVGQVYTTTVRLNVRSSAPSGTVKKTYASGTRFTCKEIKNVGNDIWMRTPSGWVAAYYNGKYYIK